MGNRETKTVVSKIQLHTSIVTIEAKLKQLRTKKTNENKKKIKDIVSLLKNKNIVLAKLKMDLVIRDMRLISACDILIHYCQTITDKITYILTSTYPPEDIREALDTIIWSSIRLSDYINEFNSLCKSIEVLYGTVYITTILETAEYVKSSYKDKLTLNTIDDNILTYELKKITIDNCLDIHFPEEIVFTGSMSNPFVNC